MLNFIFFLTIFIVFLNLLLCILAGVNLFFLFRVSYFLVQLADFMKDNDDEDEDAEIKEEPTLKMYEKIIEKLEKESGLVDLPHEEWDGT